MSASAYLEHQLGLGEDAKPLILCAEASGVLAVFDGMGGAGSQQYAVNGEMHTGAWYASRLAREVVEDFFSRVVLHTPDLAVGDEGVAQLRGMFRLRLDRWAARLGASTSQLRGKMFRVLPTTAAIIAFRTRGQDALLEVIWAGDSRAYVLSPHGGLAQLTLDDLKTAVDADQNLSRDIPVSNVLQAGGEFTLHYSKIEARLPCVLVAATDGCFGYVDTPAHFEHLLLRTMREAKSLDDWGRRLGRTFDEIAGDDCAFAALALGWPDLGAMSKAFEHREREILESAVRPVDAIREQIEALKGQVGAAEAEYKSVQERVWIKYRTGYEQYLPSGSDPA